MTDRMGKAGREEGRRGGGREGGWDDEGGARSKGWEEEERYQHGSFATLVARYLQDSRHASPQSGSDKQPPSDVDRRGAGLMEADSAAPEAAEATKDAAPAAHPREDAAPAPALGPLGIVPQLTAAQVRRLEDFMVRGRGRGGRE